LLLEENDGAGPGLRRRTQQSVEPLSRDVKRHLQTPHRPCDGPFTNDQRAIAYNGWFQIIPEPLRWQRRRSSGEKVQYAIVGEFSDIHWTTITAGKSTNISDGPSSVPAGKELTVHHRMKVLPHVTVRKTYLAGGDSISKLIVTPSQTHQRRGKHHFSNRLWLNLT